MYMVAEEDGVQYSIQTLKLELYLEEVRGKSTRHIYRTNIKGSDKPLRRYRRKSRLVNVNDPYGVYEDR